MLSHNEWFEIVCESYLNPPVKYGGQILPSFPSDLIQKRTTGQAGIPTLKEAFIFFQDCVDTFENLGSPAMPHNSLLDFGVGWGRIARFFLKNMPIENIYGIDVMEEFVDICKTTFKTDNFLVTKPFPPTQYLNDQFDFIVGYSVFSHLSEKACRSWMEEFQRIVKPGGIVALTTRSRHFFDFCENLKTGDHEGYLEALSRLFEDFSKARACYDQGEFVHSNVKGVDGGGAMTSEFYGETFIPEKYAREAYSDLFSFEQFLFDPKRQMHPVMFFRKMS